MKKKEKFVTFCKHKEEMQADGPRFYQSVTVKVNLRVHLRRPLFKKLFLTTIVHERLDKKKFELLLSTDFSKKTKKQEDKAFMMPQLNFCC